MDSPAQARSVAPADALLRAADASAAVALPARLRERICLPAYAIALAAFALYTAFSVNQWRHFGVPSWDLGIFTELAQQYANVMAPIVDIKGPGFNLLGDHFHPILVLLGPIYRMFPSGLTLLIVQNALFALSVVPMVRYAQRKLGTWPAVALGVAYALSFCLSEAVKSQFHEIAFAVPLLAYGLVAWIEGRRRAALIELGLLVFVKEDLGLTLAMLGIVELWRLWGAYSDEGAGAGAAGGQRAFPKRTADSLLAAVRAKEATYPITFVLWGVIWFVLAIFVLLPALNPNGGWDYTGNLGTEADTASGFLAFLGRAFGPGEKMVTLVLLAATAGVVGLRSPYMWLMLPTLAWRFLGNVNTYWGWAWHYSAVLLPMAMIALIDGVALLRGWGALRESWRRNLAWAAVGISLFTSVAMTWAGPFGGFLRGSAYQLSDESVAAAQGAVEAVGKSRHVVTDLRLLAYLVPDNRVYWEGTVGDARIDTVAVSPASSVMSADFTPAEWAANRFGGTWETVYSVDDYVVLKLAE